jgi:hypothetical protein
MSRRDSEERALSPRLAAAAVIVTAALGPAALGAQTRTIALDASVGFRSGAQRAAVSAWRDIARLPLGVRLGLGLRVSPYSGDPVAYANRDSVQGALASSLVIDPGVVAINGAIAGELPLGTVSIGANLDLVGVSFGPTRRMGALEAKPEAASYFQYESADHGALNSEFFVAVRLSRLLQLRAGLSHYVTDYLVTDTGATGNPTARYQKFQTVPFVAVRRGF